MEKIKVVYIVEDLKLGGLERVVETYTKKLNSDKFIVRVICLCAGGEIADALIDSTVKIEIIGLASSYDIHGMCRLINKLREFKPEIVHTHGITGNGLGRLAAGLAGVKTIFAHFHTTVEPYTFKQEMLEKYLGGITCKYLCCSKAVAKSAEEIYKIDSKKLEVIYNGVDIDIFRRQIDAHSLPRKAKRIGCIASLYPHKGHRYLIEAVPYVKEKLKEPFEVILVGRGVLLDELKKQVVGLGLEDIVLFHDAISDIGQLINWFDLVVLPSAIREGLGIVLLEAMAASIPVIGTDLGGIPELIEDGVNGILVPPKNANAIADAIVSILSDKTKADAMGIEGFRVVTEKFSHLIIIEQLEGIYVRELQKK